MSPLNSFLRVKDKFDERRPQIEDFVFQTLNPFSTNAEENSKNGRTSPSRVYTYNDFFLSLRSLAVDGIYGDAYHILTNPFIFSESNRTDTFNTPENSYVNHDSNRVFYISQEDPAAKNAMYYAIVNICAFLANAMVESIQFDSCEEWNGMPMSSGTKKSEIFDQSSGEWVLSELSGVNGRFFPMSNACGQFGTLYQQSDQCLAVDGDDFNNRDIGNNSILGGVDMSCAIDRMMEIEAAPHPKYNYQKEKENSILMSKRHQPPPPFFCGPKRNSRDYVGYWDGYLAEFVRDVAYPSVLGKVDVEGCCYWGRGALGTKNVCNFGRINYYMGNRAYQDGRPSRYPNIDFCETPWIICDTTNAMGSGLVYPELKWMVAIFEWIDRVQAYQNTTSKWNYMTQLKNFVDDGAIDFHFIDRVSSVLARGCDEIYCSTNAIHDMYQRKVNFETLINDIFAIHVSLNSSSIPSLEPQYDYEYAERWLLSKRSKIEGNIFISKNQALDGLPYFSQAYRFESFISALRKTALYGLDDKSFFIGDSKEGLRGLNAGLVNLAAFFANVMVESIGHDACDELNWETDASGRYAISNSCGQNGRDYAEEECPDTQLFMTCYANPKMKIEASTFTTSKLPFLLENMPPPFHCQPGNDAAGYFQSSEALINETVYPNAVGRVDVQSCCWWGRGALSTKGTCNLGKLNFFLGARAADDNRPSFYPNIDFCENPEAICTDQNTMEIRWVVAIFEWIDRVQSYNNSGTKWDYNAELYRFVDGGMEDFSFIQAVSNIFGRGCDSYPCSSASSVKSNRLLYELERKINFQNIIYLVFDLPVVYPYDSLSTTFPPSVSHPGFLNPYVDFDNLPRFPPTISPMYPTRSPIESSNITIYNNGDAYVIDEDGPSFVEEILIVTKYTNITLKKGSYVTAPIDSDWPAIRLSFGSMLNGTGGVVIGSLQHKTYDDGGGVAIHISNGESSPQTASYAEFYNGIKVLGGDAPGGIGGDALIVNGVKTKAVIYGGEFIAGSGKKADGFSVRVFNSGKVHIHGGKFKGDMKAEGDAWIMFYGCFLQRGRLVSGFFVDDTEVSVVVDGGIKLMPISEQKCQPASLVPTKSPMLYPVVAPPLSNGDERMLLSTLATFLLFLIFLL